MIQLLKQLKFKYNNIVIFVIICIPTFSFGQINLVVNPDVEKFDSCPDNITQLVRANGWWELNTEASCDYMQTCSVNPTVHVPSYLGFQLPQSGNGYIHACITHTLYPQKFMTDWGPDYGLMQAREAFAGSFIQPLKPVPHKIEFYVNATTINGSSTFTNAFDMLLLNDKKHLEICYPNAYEFSDVIQIYKGDTVIRDTMHWVKISTCFLPKGGGQYFAIGAFRDTNEILLEYGVDEFNQHGDIYVSSYYFDSFKVYECNDCCLDAFEYDDAVTLVNNPASSSFPPQFTVVLHGQTTAALIIYDSAGRLVKKIPFSEMYTEYVFNETLAQGMYHYAFESSNGTHSTGKLLIVN
jgi:hypothetical protein